MNISFMGEVDTMRQIDFSWHKAGFFSVMPLSVLINIMTNVHVFQLTSLVKLCHIITFLTRTHWTTESFLKVLWHAIVSTNIYVTWPSEIWDLDINNDKSRGFSLLLLLLLLLRDDAMEQSFIIVCHLMSWQLNVALWVLMHSWKSIPATFLCETMIYPVVIKIVRWHYD